MSFNVNGEELMKEIYMKWVEGFSAVSWLIHGKLPLNLAPWASR